MIAKLERMLKTTYQNKDQTQNLHKQWELQVNNESTTEPLS